MSFKIISQLTTAALTYGQSLASPAKVALELHPEFSDVLPTRWVAILQLKCYGPIVETVPQEVDLHKWVGSGDTLEAALTELAKSLHGHIQGELFVARQRCADAEVALQELTRDVGELWEDPENAEQVLEQIEEGQS